MMIIRFALLSLAATLASCQQTPTTTNTPAAASTAATDSTSAMTPTAPTEAAARAAVASYIRALPNAALYVADSARAVDVGDHWQLLVPRTDWAGRMPNRAAFEVDKASGTVTTRPVK
jgi:hypothetical protein